MPRLRGPPMREETLARPLAWRAPRPTYESHCGRRLFCARSPSELFPEGPGEIAEKTERLYPGRFSSVPLFPPFPRIPLTPSLKARFVTGSSINCRTIPLTGRRAYADRNRLRYSDQRSARVPRLSIADNALGRRL